MSSALPPAPLLPGPCLLPLILSSSSLALSSTGLSGGEGRASERWTLHSQMKAPCHGDGPEDVWQSKSSRKLQPGLALPSPYFLEAVEALQAVSCQLRGMGRGQWGSRRKAQVQQGEGSSAFGRQGSFLFRDFQWEILHPNWRRVPPSPLGMPACAPAHVTVAKLFGSFFPLSPRSC